MKTSAAADIVTSVHDTSFADVTMALSYGRYLMHVTAPADVHARVQSYLKPYVEFAATAGSRPSVWLRCVADADRMTQLRAEFRAHAKDELVLHGNACGLQLQRAGQKPLVWNIGDDVVYETSRADDLSRLTFICESFTSAACLDLVRIVRGVLARGAECLGARKIHAACVSRQRAGLAFIGRSGAGKTSFALAALQSKWADALIANDKALLYSEGTSVRVLGIPYAVSVGEGALQNVRSLQATTDRRIINGESYFWPRLVAQSLKCGLERAAPLRAIVQVELDLEAAVPSLSRTSLDEVVSDMLMFSEEMHPFWLHPLLSLNGEVAEAELAMSNTPVWKLHGNPWRTNFSVLDELFVSS